MDWLNGITLAILQGITEFLPISSSAHLILPSYLLGWTDQGLAFDVALHIGTLLAVISYLRSDIILLCNSWLASSLSLINGQQLPVEQKSTAFIAWMILLASIPAAASGLLFREMIGTSLRTPLIIAIATIVFGILLGWAEFSSKKTRQLSGLKISDALWIGIAQAIALIPGTSRSGITLTAALLLGFDRTSAARFSFLLSIPVIAGAGAILSIELISSEQQQNWTLLITASIASFSCAMLCIHYFLALIERFGLWPFVIYRLLLGCLLCWLIW